MQLEQKKGKYSPALVSFSGLVGGVVAPAVSPPLFIFLTFYLLSLAFGQFISLFIIFTRSRYM